VIDLGKKNVLGVMIDAVDYEAAIRRVIDAATTRRPCSVSALAVHGVMVGADDDEHRYRLNHLDLVTPDGQPVRWALRFLHGVRLPDRVYGPRLTSRVLRAAEEASLSVYFYGSRQEVIDALVGNVRRSHPRLRIAGAEPSMFRTLTEAEQRDLVERIRAANADIVFVGLGCPRQEVFAYENREALGRPLLAVGAAFEYLAGLQKEPQEWIQRAGLQWAHRLVRDPRRLWRRYLVLNPRYARQVLVQRLHGDETRQPPRAPTAAVRFG
jgi:exopolysaccharide biosynthesis WecB/TagA/CpsF family protein